MFKIFKTNESPIFVFTNQYLEKNDTQKFEQMFYEGC